MALVWCDGFDWCTSQDDPGRSSGPDDWTRAGSGTRSLQAGRYGGQCIRIVSSSIQGYHYRTSAAGHAEAYAGTSSAMFNAQLVTAIDAGTNANFFPFFAFTATASGVIVLSYNPSTMEFRATHTYGTLNGSGPGTTIVTSTPLGADISAAWHHFEVHLFEDDVSGTLKLLLDKVEVMSFTGDTEYGTINGAAIRGGFVSSGERCTHEFDDFSWTYGNASPLGIESRVMTLLPTSDDAADWTASAGGNVFDLVDVVDADTTYIEESNDTDRASFGFEDLSYDPAEILGVNVLAVGKRSAGAGTASAAVFIKEGVSTYHEISQNLGLTTTYGPSMNSVWAENPATTSPWTSADISGIIAGVRNDIAAGATTDRVTFIGLNVCADIEVAPAPPSGGGGNSLLMITM